MKCPYCDGNAIQRGKLGSGKRRFSCKKCKSGFSDTGSVVSPNILFLDIETSLSRTYTFGIREQYIKPDQIETDWYLHCWSAKWGHEAEVFSDVQTPKESINRDDRRILESVWELMNAADIIVAHNGDEFDIKMLNARFIINHFKPPLPYTSIDTLKIARAVARFPSNKLDEINKRIGKNRKISNEGLPLWIACFNGDKTSLLEMEHYNRGDVLAVEDLYSELRVWMRGKINMGVYAEGDDTSCCPNCKSGKVTWTNKTYATPANLYRAFRCNSCGAVGRGKDSLLDKDYRKKLLRN